MIQYNGPVTQYFLDKHKEVNHQDIPAGELNALLHADRCSVSVGNVSGVNNLFVSYTNSSSRGASGAPIFVGNSAAFCAIRIPYNLLSMPSFI